jgi:hypothetical protein
MLSFEKPILYTTEESKAVGLNIKSMLMMVFDCEG